MVSPVNQNSQNSQGQQSAKEIVTGPDGRSYERRPDGLYPEGHISIYPGEGKVTFMGNSAVATKSMVSASSAAAKTVVKK